MRGFTDDFKSNWRGEGLFEREREKKRERKRERKRKRERGRLVERPSQIDKENKRER